MVFSVVVSHLQTAVRCSCCKRHEKALKKLNGFESSVITVSVALQLLVVVPVIVDNIY